MLWKKDSLIHSKHLLIDSQTMGIILVNKADRIPVIMDLHCNGKEKVSGARKKDYKKVYCLRDVLSAGVVKGRHL